MARILLTEDEESLRAFVKRALEMEQHEVVEAQDGQEALDIIIAENGAFDLLLSDVKMPYMDGIALAMTVGRDYPKLPVLLMTGFADQRERAEALDGIVIDVVSKPFTLPEICVAVADALQDRGNGAEISVDDAGSVVPDHVEVVSHEDVNDDDMDVEITDTQSASEHSNSRHSDNQKQNEAGLVPDH